MEWFYTLKTDMLIENEQGLRDRTLIILEGGHKRIQPQGARELLQLAPTQHVMVPLVTLCPPTAPGQNFLYLPMGVTKIGNELGPPCAPWCIMQVDGTTSLCIVAVVRQPLMWEAKGEHVVSSQFSESSVEVYTV